MTGAAFLQGRHANLGFGAVRSFFEADLQVVAQVGTAIDAVAPVAAPPAEDVAEDVGEGIGKAAASAETAAAHPRLRIHASVAELVWVRDAVSPTQPVAGPLTENGFFSTAPDT